MKGETMEGVELRKRIIDLWALDDDIRYIKKCEQVAYHCIARNEFEEAEFYINLINEHNFWGSK